MKFVMKNKRLPMFTAISLTDIVLLLLIYFMLTSSFVMPPGIKVTLPKATTGQQEETGRIELTITKEEQLFLNGQSVSADDLPARLQTLLKGRQDKTIILHADKNLTLEATVRVIDLAKLAGAEKFMIATEPIL